MEMHHSSEEPLEIRYNIKNGKIKNVARIQREPANILDRVDGIF
jgi:hypothetical protein